MGGVRIFCDGSCNNNKDAVKLAKVGGFGIVILSGKERVIGKFAFGPFPNTNSAEMELKALMFSLRMCREYGWKNAHIFSDSDYCVKTYNNYLSGWMSKGKTNMKFPKTWKRIHGVKKQVPEVKVIWIRGHNGNKFNHMADKLANQARKSHSME